jgi:hypothetical protein
MKGAKTRFFVVLVFALVLLGGGAAGMLAARYASKEPAPLKAENTSLSEELQLSLAQQNGMRTIWQAMRDRATDYYAQAQAIERERQDAYMQILTEDQKKQYEKIQRDYQDKFTKLTATRQGAFDEAVKATKNLLNEDQRRRYDTILSKRLGQTQSDTVHFEPTTASGIKSSSISPSQPLASPG